MASDGDKVTAMPAPEDKYKLVYVVFVMLGIGTLLPWNMFITVNAYWNYKLRSVNETYDEAVEAAKALADNVTYNGKLSEMQEEWGPQVTVASMVPNVTILILNAVFGHRFKTQPRLLVSLILVIVLFGFTSAMTMIPSDTWQRTFLYVTLVSVVFINISAATFQGN